MRLIAFIISIVSLLYSQSQENFLGSWTGLENLDSPSMSYDNRNLSLIISEGGDREGYFIYTSSCNFLYDEDLSWSYHYFRFNKDTGQIIFLRRFITPLGLLGFEELTYDIIDWLTDFFVAEYYSNDGITFHQLRVFLNFLDIYEPIPTKIELSKNFPNPFNPSTTIQVDLTMESNLSVYVYDIIGREVRALLNENRVPGIYSVRWDGKDNAGHDVSTGTYFFLVTTADHQKVIKAIYLR